MRIGLLLLCWSLAAIAKDYGFRVKEADLVRQGDMLALSATIQYRFSPTLVEALHHGVPLTLTVKVRLLQPRRGLWDERLWQRRLNFRIQYYPLAQVYRVVDETNRSQRSFPRLDAALAALGELQEIALPVPENWQLPERAYAEVTVQLNIERLPWALRPQAYFTPDWRLISEPYRWPFSG
ncbi:MAG TPA: DUF4390 domain-containing protein [Methylothermaceae bacterium]|nr:DUF4390 domain-containing protein [Methylothermaceae bacterium]